MDVNKEALREALKAMITNEMKQNASDTEAPVQEPEFNSKTTNILRLADLEARMAHDTDVDVRHLILAMLHDGINSTAKDILQQNNMNYDDVLLFAQNYKNTAPQNGINLNDEEDDDILTFFLCGKAVGYGVFRASVQTCKTHRTASVCPYGFAVFHYYGSRRAVVGAFSASDA